MREGGREGGSQTPIMFFDSVQSPLVMPGVSWGSHAGWHSFGAHRQAMFLLSHTIAWLQRGCQKGQSFFILEPTHLSIDFLESVTESRGVYHSTPHRALALTLRQWSSSTPSSLLSAGTISLPSVQYIPRLLVLLCPGSCCLCLAREVTLTGVLNGDSFCSHSEIQEATEMLLQELERLCSCGWLMSCWPLEI